MRGGRWSSATGGLGCTAIVPTRYSGTVAEVAALDAHIKLMRAAGAVAARLERRLGALGLTESQFGVLEILLHLGPLSQRAIGRKLFRSGGNVTVVVDNLEKRDLVRRTRGTADRRQVTVDLTPTGRRLIEELFPGHAAAIAALYAALTPAEQAHLGALAKKLGLSVTTTAEPPTSE